MVLINTIYYSVIRTEFEALCSESTLKNVFFFLYVLTFGRAKLRNCWWNMTGTTRKRMAVVPRESRSSRRAQRKKKKAILEVK